MFGSCLFILIIQGGSLTIYTINFSIHGSNKRFFDKLNEGSRFVSSIYILLKLLNLKVILKSNSLSISKKNRINIKYSLLNKTLHFVRQKYSPKKLWRKLTKLYPMTIISSDHKNVIQFFKNHLPCPWILKIICRIKWFNPPGIKQIW